MRLQNMIFEFKAPEGVELKEGLLTSKTVVNDKVTEVTFEQLFKGKVKEKSILRYRGFSILEHLNEKGEIEIDGIVYSIKFIHNSIYYQISSIKKSKIGGARNLSEEDKTLFGNLISGKAAKGESRDAAVEEPTSAKVAESASEAAKAEVAAPILELFSPENYEEDKLDLIKQGFTEYTTDKKSNYRILSKEDIILLIELLKDDYNVIKDKALDEYDIELIDKNKSFTIEKAKDKIKA